MIAALAAAAPALAKAGPLLLKAAPYALDYLSPEATAERKRLKADKLAMERGTLGMGGAQKQEIVTRALQNVRSSQRGVEAAAMRARAAGGATVGGETSRAVKALQEPLGGIAAQASAEGDRLSAMQESSRAEDIRRRMAERRARRNAFVMDMAKTPMGEEEEAPLTGLLSDYAKGG